MHGAGDVALTLTGQIKRETSMATVCRCRDNKSHRLHVTGTRRILILTFITLFSSSHKKAVKNRSKENEIFYEICMISKKLV